jgi:hypothetical protein
VLVIVGWTSSWSSRPARSWLMGRPRGKWSRGSERRRLELRGVLTWFESAPALQLIAGQNRFVGCWVAGHGAEAPRTDLFSTSRSAEFLGRWLR